MKLIVAWIMTFLFAKAAPGRPQFLPEAQETREAAEARYESIAADIAAVVWDPNEAPLFRGPSGRLKTTSMILSVMLHESAFRRDVDFGLGKAGKGDGGRSWCLMQINLGQAGASGKTAQRIVLDNGGYRFVQGGTEGFGGEDLVTNRKSCIRAGLHLLRRSFGACGRLPQQHWLNAYASGSCDAGHEASQNRMGTAFRWYQAHTPGFVDKEVTLLTDPSIPVALNN